MTSFLQTYMIFLMKQNKSILLIMVVLQKNFVGSQYSLSWSYLQLWLAESLNLYVFCPKVHKVPTVAKILSNITSDFHKHS
jgi:hypothetical protein